MAWREASMACAALVLAAATGFGQDVTFYNVRPYLQALTSSSVIIVSQSEQAVVGRLRHGTDINMEGVTEEAEPVNEHVFRLEGLETGSTYYYEVEHVGVRRFSRASFRTLPGPGEEVLAAAIGDSGTLSDAQYTVAEAIKALAPQLLLHTGDVVYPYGTRYAYYRKFFRVYDFLGTTCAYMTLGNHDCQQSPEHWRRWFHTLANNPAGDEGYYSFDAGDAHIVALNSCTYEVPVEQLLWLDADLEAAARTWKIVFFHHAPYSNAFHNGTVAVRDAVVPILERRGVDLVLSGHEHVYERSFPVFEGIIRDGFQEPNYTAPRGILYVVTGGGGASLYQYRASPEAHLSAVFHEAHNFLSLRITPHEIEGRAIGLDGGLLDRFTLRKPGERPPPSFVRGDANQDGDADLVDAIAVLQYLFLGGIPPCLAAGDANASGSVTITDPLHLLNFLFRGGPPPEPPFPDCGIVEGADDRGCKGRCEEE